LPQRFVDEARKIEVEIDLLVSCLVMTEETNFLQLASLPLTPIARPDSQEGRWPAQEKDIDNWLPINARRNAKWWYSAFHNVTAMVGAGVLGLPYAMSELGWYVRDSMNISTFHGDRALNSHRFSHRC